MLRTLHGYLTRDLLKGTLLSLIAITLLMTVLAIIQPLRQMGLAGEQVLSLFLFTLPVMLSFTLPVATLFAATLVYGRFSQDRELLACRASGISTMTLLRPALILGLVVTAMSLVLSNFIAPNLQTMAMLAQSNVRGLVYNRLNTVGHVDYFEAGKRHIIHADSVDVEHDQLDGIVYAYIRVATKKDGARSAASPAAKAEGAKKNSKKAKAREAVEPNDSYSKMSGAYLASATGARLHFDSSDSGQNRLTIQPIDLSVVQTGDRIAPSRSFSMGSNRFLMPVENPIKDKPSFYRWDELLRAYKDPSLTGGISRQLEKIRKRICSDLLSREIVTAISGGRKYAIQGKGDESYELSAPAVDIDEHGAADLHGPTQGATAPRPVVMTVLRAGKPFQTVAAQVAQVSTEWSRMADEPQVTIRLEGDIEVAIDVPGGRQILRPEEWVRGEIRLPADVRDRVDKLRPADLCSHPELHTRNEQILKEIRALQNVQIPRLRDALLAELHSRVAYGVSCFLMVAMGAALGLMFRGGQFISAFAISAVPASAVITMLLMGKGMVRNQDLPPELGLTCIWGGIVLLVLANIVIYIRLARR